MYHRGFLRGLNKVVYVYNDNHFVIVSINIFLSIVYIYTRLWEEKRNN